MISEDKTFWKSHFDHVYILPASTRTLLETYILLHSIAILINIIRKHRATRYKFNNFEKFSIIFSNILVTKRKDYVTETSQ